MRYFISGHRDLTWEEFTKWYAPAISNAINNDRLACFVIGDCDGADKMAGYTSLVYSYSILKCLKSCPIRIQY